MRILKFTAALLQLYCSFTAALLLLLYCSFAVSLQDANPEVNK
jgi:hypothetical protein